uniref:Uncharacterized protein n=1 Tax=Nonomuraea gerenzanensis TaxID=93944 RepID=A0A1M4EGR3_9ACTN|nr:hypothetical protein BN4615_P7526 [Nonomuraea gerenzanensis]
MIHQADGQIPVRCHATPSKRSVFLGRPYSCWVVVCTSHDQLTANHLPEHARKAR